MLTIRSATSADASLIHRMIQQLADFANESEHVRTTGTDILRDGFSANPQFRALIAEWNGHAAGFALFFNYYSTWRGAGLYLEDLYILPDFRRRGIGRALFASVAQAATKENLAFVRWTVLSWNQPAIEMYKATGAAFLDDWRTAVLAGDELQKLASDLL